MTAPMLADRPVFSLAETDRLLGLRRGTTRRWIKRHRGGASDDPAIARADAGQLSLRGVIRPR